jgi:hypothetical protein
VRTLILFGEVLLDQAVSMGGYFLLAVVVAAGIKSYKLDKKIRQLVGRAGIWSIPLATTAGLVSPLCSCGILPVISSLAVAGVPPAPLMALLLTSPVMSPDALVLTAGVLGSSFAVGKVAGAVLVGLGGGYLVLVLQRWGHIPEDAWRSGRVKAVHHCVDEEDPSDPRRGLTVRMPRGRYFLLMVGDMVWIIGRFLALAFVIQAALAVLVPANLFLALARLPDWTAIPAAALVGLPLPLHQVAVVPILKGLLDRGIGPGVAMTLLLAGPLSSIPAMVYLAGMARRELLLLYLATGFTCSVLAGFLFAALG